MKENFINKEFSSSLKESYESPKCEILFVESEGVLCGSGGNGAGMQDFTIDEGNSFGTDIWK